MQTKQPERAGHSRGSPTTTSNIRCIAAIEVASLVPSLEPLLAHRGRAVGPLLGLHTALRLLLDAVVADRSRGVERLGNLGIRGCLEEAGVRGVPRPNAGEAIGLQ